MKNTFLAIELETSGSRAILGELNDGILSLKEIHRFSHEPVLGEGRKYWNIEWIFQQIKKSLVIVADQNLPVESLGITAWGVDFSLMGEDGIPMQPLISGNLNNDGNLEGFAQRITEDKIYGQTGIPVSHVTSLFQLAALKKKDSDIVKKAKHLLFMPDIFNFLLTGIMNTEFSIATTSQLYNPVKRMWDHEIFKALGIQVSIMSRIVEHGNSIGSISNNISYETGISRIPVVAVASLNTASAIVSMPTPLNNWAFIRIDSMCQIGFESVRPIINKKSQQLNFANIGGAGNTFQILRNLPGLSLLEECQKAWMESNNSLSDLVSLAVTSTPFTAFIDTDHSSFINPDNIQTAVAEYCGATGQNAAQTDGEIARTILEGLAFKVRIVLEQIEALRGVKSETIYSTTSGSKNELLSQFTADCCGIPVITLSEESTAAGNILVQALALGIVKDVTEIREITGKSFPTKTFEPSESEKWNAAFEKYRKITNQL